MAQERSATGAVASPATSEWRGGWRTLVAAFMAMGVGWNFALIAASLFLKPMQADFGWSRTELSFGPLAGLIVALLLPVTGLLLDRFGARRIAILGLLAIASAFTLFACIPADHTLFLGATIFMGFAGSICNSIVLARGVTPWFERNLGAALGLMMTGASVSAALAAPALTVLIEAHGWRAGFWALAGVTIALGLPLVLFWFREPTALPAEEKNDHLKRDSMRVLMGSAAFWQLTIGSGVAALPIGGFIGHLIPMLNDRGLSAEVAASFGAVFALAVGVGRIVNGALLDRLHPPLVIFATLSLAAAGAAFLSQINPSVAFWMLASSIALIGLAQGAEGDYINFFSMRLFGLGNFARVVSIMAMVISLGMALGGIIFAKVYDTYGTYQPAVIGSIMLYAFGGLVFAAIRMRPRPSAATTSRKNQPSTRMVS